LNSTVSSVLGLEAELSVGPLTLDLALAVEQGETVALVGPSGAGKTTALRIVAGLVQPRSGRVVCADETWLDTARRISLAPELRRCGYLFQHHALFPHLRAWQNVAYGLTDLPRRQRRERALELLARFGVDRLADSSPRTLSGGERQRVALARALARWPSTLLLDEPLSALDTRTRADAGRELAALVRDLNAPALLVTHDFEQASLLAERVAVLDHGRIVQVGSPAELTAAPRSAFVADFTGAVVLQGVAGPGPQGLTAVALDGGGSLVSTDSDSGPVAASVHPWEIALEPPGERAVGSAQNRLPVSVSSVTVLGNRVRVGLLAPQPLTAELTLPAVDRLGVRPGARFVASWKATATRLVPR
jgi:molybdate transport system ATP-binding protein